MTQKESNKRLASLERQRLQGQPKAMTEKQIYRIIGKAPSGFGQPSKITKNIDLTK